MFHFPSIFFHLSFATRFLISCFISCCISCCNSPQKEPSPGVLGVYGDNDTEFWEHTFRKRPPEPEHFAGGVPPACGVAKSADPQLKGFDPNNYQNVDEKTGHKIALRNSNFDPSAYQGVDEGVGQQIAMRNSLEFQQHPHMESSLSVPNSPKKPKAKRSKAEQLEDFSSRCVNETTGRLSEDPLVLEASMKVLDDLSAPGHNVLKTIVGSKTNKGAPAVGESPAVVDTLIKVEQIRIGRKS